MERLKEFDRQCALDGYDYLVGIDEAGRGPLAGPVVAAAVLLKTQDFSVKIQDSKKMTAKQRYQAFFEIQDQAYVGIGIMNERIIDMYNILEATFLAMNEAVRQLNFCLVQAGCDLTKEIKKVCLLIDGNRFKTYLPYTYRTIVSGDDKSLSIACASVVAKVTRDRILDQYHQIFPQYGFDQHKGYPTASHRKAIAQYGPVLIHRKTFRMMRAA
jgi:ribonuclease HII